MDAVATVKSIPSEGIDYPKEYYCSAPQFMPDYWQKQPLANAIAHLMQLMLKFRVDIENTLVYCRHSHTFDHIVKKVLTGELHFYVYRQSALLMEVQRYPEHSVYHCFIGCGNIEDLHASEPIFNEHAKLLGCKYITQSGRIGWVKSLKSRGWEHSHSAMFKPVQ